ncbi:uncharacterized protein [Antedon mediterranea]|uniref:uncharacterized protein n=1 Tax=Antedon mediterranea TaxID=105859 RepID=UPI003AF5F2E5
MLLRVLCFCILNVYIYGNFGDSVFKYSGSRYTIVNAVHNNFETRRDAREFCESHGELLVSLTTADEAAAVNDFMSTHYPNMNFVVGLSREAGLDRDVDSNWIWETGEHLDSDVIKWHTNRPEINNTESAGCRMDDGYLKDSTYHDKLWSSYLICKRVTSEFYIVGDKKVHSEMPVYLRCAIRCLRDYGCNGFYVDDTVCHIEMEKVNKHH